MDMSKSSASSSSSSFSHMVHTSHASATTSSAQTLYYYNVDAILSELIRPATPKHGNLARPRLVKPEPIRPQQLIGIGGDFNSHHHHHHHRRSSSNHKTSLSLLNDRMEGARNPDPIQQQLKTPFAIDDDDNEGEDGGMTYGIGGVIDTLNYDYNSTSSSSKRSRDDEDILYYKKGTKSTTTEEKKDAVLVTPNPIQYYTSSVASSQPTMNAGSTSAMLTYDHEPQYIVYKNYIDESKNSTGSNSHHENDRNSNLMVPAYHHFPNSHHAWTTTTPSTTVSYTIVKPVAMRPMDVIQHLDHYHHYDRNTMTTQPDTSGTTTTISTCPPPKNLLQADLLEDGSMQVCG